MTVLDEFRARHGLTGTGGPLRTASAGRLALCELLRDLGFTKGAEIGVWEGDFSEKLCRAIPRLSLIGVDPWAPYADYRERKNDPARLEAAFAATKKRLQPFHCTLMRMTSLEAAARVPDGSLDFAYVDGNHERPFIDQDLAAWLPKVRPGGIFAGHDYVEHPKKPYIQVKPAVDEFTTAHGIASWFVLASDKSPSWFWVVT